MIDIDLVVADPADEPSYIPDLTGAAFAHTLREPWWHEHRLVKWADPTAHVQHLWARLSRGDPAPDVS